MSVKEYKCGSCRSVLPEKWFESMVSTFGAELANKLAETEHLNCEECFEKKKKENGKK